MRLWDHCSNSEVDLYNVRLYNEQSYDNATKYMYFN